MQLISESRNQADSRALRWIAGAVALATLLAACGSHPGVSASKKASNNQPITSTSSNASTPPSPGSQSPSGAGAVAPAHLSGTGLALGVYVKPGSGGGTGTLSQFLSATGGKLSVIQTFTGWQDGSAKPIGFPSAFASYVESYGATPMITWQPEGAGKASQTATKDLAAQPSFSLSTIAGDKYDSYIASWAEQAKAFGHPVLVRMMHEMNDSTYPWSIGVNGNTSASQYIAAWRHIVSIFLSVGATNVQFVWCVGAAPATPNPAIYFPGDEYVSWISIDGYNRSAKKWRTFAEIFAKPYQEITAVSSLPVMIAETGSVEQPGSVNAKAQWITTAFLETIPQEFPRIKAVLYFDAPGRGFDYPLDSSSQAMAAFHQVATSPTWGG